jgi:hypothetical protein
MANKKKFEKADKAMDKKKGIKEGSKQDIAMDKKVAMVHATRSMKVMNQALGGRYGK